MASVRKVVTRAESQQYTREEILDSAEELFLADGLHGTTVAKIAAEAGRTQGAIYGNFDSKENLCAEVLLRRGMRMLDEIFSKMSGLLDDPVGPLVESWQVIAGDDDLVALLIEYAIAVHKNPEQLEVSRGHVEMGLGMLETVLSGTLPLGTPLEERDAGAKGVASAALGLALSQALGFVSETEASALLERTIRIWIADLATAQGSPGS